MASVPDSTEQHELTLVGKVEMRLALADSDSKLQTLLDKFLAPLLLKLASEYPAVGEKVVAVCQHIRTRVKPESIQLPVAKLVEQFKSQESPVIRHFDLLFIQQGVGRLSATQKAGLLPVIAKGISSSGKHGSQIFNLFLRLLDFYTLPPRASKEDRELRTQFGLSDEDAQYLAEWLGKLILFPGPQDGLNRTYPGLTLEDYRFLKSESKGEWDWSTGGMRLQHIKVLAASLIGSGIFTDEERFIPALYASADPAAKINSAGEDIFKRTIPGIDLEQVALIGTFFTLYFGTDDRPRVRTPVRLKVLGLLNKSRQSASFSSQIMKLVDDGIHVRTNGWQNMTPNTLVSNSAGQGREASKVRSAVFAYINFVTQHGPRHTLRAIAAPVINQLKEFIEEQGWPSAGTNDDLVSRGYAYEMIGLLGKAAPRDVLVETETPTMDLLRFLFASLAKENSGPSTVVSVEESLSTILTAMSQLSLSATEETVLEDLLVDQMHESADSQGKQVLRSTRYVAVRFANRCLPYRSVKARWVDILGLGATSDRGEVREEAERGLNPHWHRMLNGSMGSSSSQSMTFPTFLALIDQFFPGRTLSAPIEPTRLAQNIHRTHKSSFRELTSFCRRLLFHEALLRNDVSTKIDSEWERSIDTAIERDLNARNAAKTYLVSHIESLETPLKILACALFESMIIGADGFDGHLNDFIALAPDEVITVLVPRSSELLLPLTRSSDQNFRITCSKTYGILATHPAAASAAISGQINSLHETCTSWSTATGTATYAVHGSFGALAFYYSRTVRRGNKMEMDTAFSRFVDVILRVIQESRDALLKEAAFIALGQLCLFMALPVESILKIIKIRTLIDQLCSTARTGNEAAILCLGQLSMILPEEVGDDGDLRYLEDQLRKLHDIRQAEVHFTVGEALSCIAAGWNSNALATASDVPGPVPSSRRSSTLQGVIERVFHDCASTKPALKKAATIWLLCLVQFCGDHKEMQARLPTCQRAFTSCLSDRDELVQESASRGLGLVYEKGDRGLKDDLVRDLVSSFSSDKQSKLAGNVSAETQLFEPGMLPTGDGSVSTYKDIMSLAAEVGDSSLVYKFMSIASENAIWSSRAAFGRFGLTNILTDSAVDDHLARNLKLYPKLYRYRFDPSSGVQRSMNTIWNALVKDSSAAIEQHFSLIMEDLLHSILAREWRTRQASCAAIADLISGRSLPKYEPYLDRIWQNCFKVMDDIKESVRGAATSLARTLTGALTRALEADHSSTKSSSAMLKHVLPFLLSPSGVESGAKEVQGFAISTLLEIIKKSSGNTLRPFIPELVEQLIGLLSSVEPEAVNYIHLNAAKYNLTEQKIDDMRLTSVRSSPLMEAIERCLDLLDDETMKSLQPRLEYAMKSAVGLPSKVGSGRVLVSLATRRMMVFRPFSDDALKLIEKLVIDRNETVASSYAVAAGYVARGASDKQILKLIAYAKKLFFESEGDRETSIPRRSLTAGELMLALAKHASDRLNSLALSALPFVFVAKHDPAEIVREAFMATWEDSVGGSRAVLLYLSEIAELCSQHLESPQWALKHAAASSVAEVVTVIVATEANMNQTVAERLWPLLERALGGKTWEGKEAVVYAFGKYCEAAESYYTQHPEVASAITKIALREAKRQNPVYRQHSIKVLGQVGSTRKDVDISAMAFETLAPLLASDDDAMEVDGEDAAKADELHETVRAAAVGAMLASINPHVLQGQNLFAALQRATGAIASMSERSQSVRRALYAELKKLLDRAGSTDGQAQFESLRLLLFVSPDSEAEALRLLRADALLAAFKALPCLAADSQDELREMKKRESSKSVLGRLDMASHGE